MSKLKLFTSFLLNAYEDLIDKFEIAAKAIGEYNDPDATDLAYIRGSTLDTFGLMLEIYHTFANMDDFTNNKYTMKEYLDAYHVIQGYYNELKKKKEIYMTTVKNMKIIEDLKEDLYTKMNAICPTHKKRFMKMPDSIVKHKDEIIHNLRAYRVIDECHDENAVKNLFVEAEWPTRRQFADARNFNESNDNEYKVLKWKMKGEQFKAIEDIKNDLFT